MFWFLYIIASAFFSYLIADSRNKNSLSISLFIFIILITPAQIENTNPDLTPSLPSFLFNAFLEKDFSFRVLRPLVLSMLLFLVSILTLSKVKKIFF